MPYKSLKELPEGVRDNLPKHAQEIWKEAFNSALKQYKDPQKRIDPDEDLETVAAQVAWGAVKKMYEKNKEGEWVKK